MIFDKLKHIPESLILAAVCIDARPLRSRSGNILASPNVLCKSPDEESRMKVLREASITSNSDANTDINLAHGTQGQDDGVAAGD